MASTSPLPSPNPINGSGSGSGSGSGGGVAPRLRPSSSEGRRPSLPTRRRSSSSRHSQSAYIEEEEEEDDHFANKIPLEPPSSVPHDEELEEILAARASGEHSLGGWHYAPLVVGIGPALGAILGGKADLWSDAILLLLSSFWLFQCLKIPNDIYHAARTRRILQDDQANADDGIPPESPERRRRCQLAIAELQRTEVFALIACVISPILGAYGLHWLQLNLHDGSRYLNRFNIRLFMMAAGIRPWLHLFKLIRRRTLLLQEDVHYPSAKVESMRRRITRLEADLSSLRKTAVSRSDVRMLRDGIDVPLSQMSRSMRKYERKEENLRNLADDKFALVEARLEDLLRECAINAELIEGERLERERSSSIGRNILEAFKYALGQRRSSSTASIGHRAYLMDARSSSLAGITGPPGPDSPESSGSGGMLSSEAHQRRSTSYSGRSGASEDCISPPPRNRNRAQSQPPVASSSASAKPEWYEQGVLYWAFLPLNVSNSVLRLAGEKLGSSSASGGSSSSSKEASKASSPTSPVSSSKYANVNAGLTSPPGNGSGGSHTTSAQLARRTSLPSRAGSLSSRMITQTQPMGAMVREGSLSPPPPPPLVSATGNSNGANVHQGTSAFAGGGRADGRPAIHITTIPSSPPNAPKFSSGGIGVGGGLGGGNSYNSSYENASTSLSGTGNGNGNGKYNSAFLPSPPSLHNGAGVERMERGSGVPFSQLSLNHQPASSNSNLNSSSTGLTAAGGGGGASGNNPTTSSSSSNPASWRRSALGSASQRVKV